MPNNIDIYDFIVRRQIVVEGLKQFKRDEYYKKLNLMFEKIRIKLLSQPKDNAGELTKKQLNVLLSEILNIQNEFYTVWSEEYLNWLNLLMNEDLKVTRRMLYLSKIDKLREPDFKITDKKIQEDIKDNSALWLAGTSSLFGLAAITSNPSKLWARITASFIPANGMTIDSYIKAFVNSSKSRVLNAVKKGYSNKSSFKFLAESITNIKTSDGAATEFKKTVNSLNTLLGTTSQHVIQLTGSGVASALFNSYIWCSVLDGRTTVTCIKLDNQIFVYGDGPTPPAHEGCRSSIHPIDKDGGNIPEESFFKWLKRQPLKVQQFVLGKVEAGKLREGKKLEIDLSEFVNDKTISLNDYGDLIETLNVWS